MTRKEEIQKLIDEEMGIDNYGSCDFQVGVCYGVKFADKTMVEKACEWLKKWAYQDCLGVSPITRLKVGFSSVEELIEDFCKSMEE